LGSTFGRNPLACAAGLAAFTALEEDGLMARPATIEGMLIARLQKMMDTYKIIGDVRVKGCLAGVELVHDRVSKEPAKEKAQMVLQECQGRGVIAAPGGPYTNVVRVMPPLTISDEDLAQGLDILEAAIAKADSGR
ncbi:MAG: aminotransferase class III-fold pyridoxal phosphate-dependent enzyme, partial [candidate division KSB1 bacterium]|nr:aminotransferase class III-fold pyridoxal phosphate-dependent enzyme [candidate division KSB1 bacterium]